MSEAPLLSVIAMAYNQRPYTEMLVASLADPRIADRPFELLFIDNGSTDGTQAWLEHFPLAAKNPLCRGIHIHRHAENRGVAAAINQGVRLAQGDILLQADNDVIFGPGSFSCLMDFAAAHPGAMISPQWPWIQKRLGVTFFRSVADVASAEKMERLVRTGRRAPLESFRATGSCWLCPRTLFEAVEGWDEGFKNICASDDFLWKIAVSGAERFTIPCAVYHPGKITRESLPNHSAQQERDLKRFFDRWQCHPEDQNGLREHQRRRGLTPDPQPPKGLFAKLFRRS